MTYRLFSLQLSVKVYLWALKQIKSGLLKSKSIIGLSIKVIGGLNHLIILTPFFQCTSCAFKMVSVLDV